MSLLITNFSLLIDGGPLAALHTRVKAASLKSRKPDIITAGTRYGNDTDDTGMEYG
jgi:hypothetical protein